MPKVNYNKNTKQIKKVQVETLTCLTCGTPKKSSEFYSSLSVFHAGTGRVPYCKVCLKSLSVDKLGNIDVEEFKKVLKEIDKPYLCDVLQSAYTESKKVENGDVLGAYFKNICSLPQYKNLNWSCSIFEPVCVDEENNNVKNNSTYNFSKEVLIRWHGYDLEDIVLLENFYNDMKYDNRIESVQDEIYLKKLAIINLEQDKAGQEKNWAMYKQLGEMFSKFMQDAKLRAQDRTESDRTGGIRNFSAVYAEVEKDDFIPPWSYYAKINGANQDIVDKTIMHIENFTLRLNKVERMVRPPQDTPKILLEEIDKDAVNNFVDINVDITEDLIDIQEDGE